MWLIVCGFFVHLVLLASIFDIYFKSPVIHNIVPFCSPTIAPAKRLVLFVADGLRADSFYNRDDSDTEPNAPYLWWLLENKASWGVSHTRIPTESRPGHVALIAGFYEDPSAVARGWKENPVEFDSVFNQSRYTWSWGSPDILPMFAKGATGDHVVVDMYNASDEDFSGAYSTSNLDTWVFDKVKVFLQLAETDDTLNKKLNSDKIVFFLHLLGLDTAGHTYKPHSKELRANIRVVDKGVKEIEKLFEQFYNHDNQTAFVFTADHGMTDWGSHGAGDKSETETPIVVWGSGVSGPLKSNSPHFSPKSWNLDHLVRRDVRQADIAPLLSSLISVPVPVNSVGSLPVDFLNVSQTQMSEAIFSNAWQMLEQYKKKRELIELGTLPFLYHPFQVLSKELETSLIADMRIKIQTGNYDQVIQAGQHIMSLALSGLDYYHNYYQRLLLTSTTLTYIGWILWLFSTILPTQTPVPLAHRSGVKKYLVNLIFMPMIAVSAFLIYIQKLPLQFHIYCLLPQLLFFAVVKRCQDFVFAINALGENKGIITLFLRCLLYLLGIEVIVLLFFHRIALSAAVVGVSIWPLLRLKSNPLPWQLLVVWFSSCLLLAVFPMLPVIGRESNLNCIVFSGLLWLVSGTCCLLLLREGFLSRKHKTRAIVIAAVQLLMFPLTTWILYTSSQSFDQRQGLPVLNQILSWSMFGMTFLIAMSGSLEMLPRLANVTLSLAVPFLLLSVSHEGLFFLALTANLFSWLFIEHRFSKKHQSKLSNFTFQSSGKNTNPHRHLNSDDFRRAFFFLFYIILSFFGTGNIASINSFDPAWVRCFVSVFSPILMMLLILWKTMVPFLAVTCVFRAINVIVEAPISQLFLIVLIFCDLLGLHFLYLVTNQGSWLDIGTSLSHFVIVHTTVLVLVLLYGAAHVLTQTTIWPIQPRGVYASLETGSQRAYENKLKDKAH